MKKSLRFTVLCLLSFAVIFLSGCLSGSASEAHAKFGILGVFSVEKNNTGITSDGGMVTAKTGDTKIQILLFVWEDSAKDVVLRKQDK